MSWVLYYWRRLPVYRFWLCSSECTVRRNLSISLFLVVFLKSVHLRDQSMDSFSPCGLLLPFWLGKVMAALLGAVWMVPSLVWVFPGNSWHFHPCPAPLPFLAIPSPPSPGGKCWAAIPEPARREQLIKEGVWQLCALSKQSCR